MSIQDIDGRQTYLGSKVWKNPEMKIEEVDVPKPGPGEVLQIRRARIVGSQGHSGHGTFPGVIEAMASGMNMLPLITKEIPIDDVPENVVMLRTDRKECKITCLL